MMESRPCSLAQGHNHPVCPFGPFATTFRSIRKLFSANNFHPMVLNRLGFLCRSENLIVIIHPPNMKDILFTYKDRKDTSDSNKLSGISSILFSDKSLIEEERKNTIRQIEISNNIYQIIEIK